MTPLEIFFIVFLHIIFTSFVKPRFTNGFDCT